MVMLLYGCSKENSIGITDFTVTGCKNNQKSLKTDSISDDKEMIELKALKNGYLSFKQINTYFNCEARVTADASLQDTIITVSETEPIPSSNCLCPYDLSFKLGPLSEGTYYCIITRGKAEYTHFTINYHADLDTTFEVVYY